VRVCLCVRRARILRQASRVCKYTCCKVSSSKYVRDMDAVPNCESSLKMMYTLAVETTYTPACIRSWNMRTHSVPCSALQTRRETASTPHTKIPTIIDPSATINYPSATGSMTVRISIPPLPYACHMTSHGPDSVS
jgi:hypothetical protein